MNITHNTHNTHSVRASEFVSSGRGRGNILFERWTDSVGNSFNDVPWKKLLFSNDCTDSLRVALIFLFLFEITHIWEATEDVTASFFTAKVNIYVKGGRGGLFVQIKA